MKAILKKVKSSWDVVVACLMYGEFNCRIWLFAICLLASFVIGTVVVAGTVKNEQETVPTTEIKVVAVSPTKATTEPTTEETSEVIETTTLEETTEPEVEDTYQDEIELLALLVMAEAEGESEEGKRLVIDTVLNRVDSGYWPDTITEVIYQANQFSPMWNGRIDRCYVTEENCQLVREELNTRTNYDVVYFRTNHYSEYGQPMFQVGNHYFSSYD